MSADPAKAFEMSPDASEATLRIRKNGKTHVVHWTGRPEAGSYSAGEFCFPSGGQGVGGGIVRGAKATADIFGRTLKGGFADLSMGAMVTQCEWAPALHFGRDGRLRSFSFSTPR